MSIRRITHTIRVEEHGKTVDHILRHVLHLSGSGVKRAKSIPDGILLNGHPVYTNHSVEKGQQLSVQVSDLNYGKNIHPTYGTLSICYEDDDLLILNKAPGMVVHPGPGHDSDTVANYLMQYYRDAKITAGFHPVNRLDGGTSGLMAVAKHAHAHERLRLQLHSGGLEREYLALCASIPYPPSGVIDLPIGRAEGQLLKREIRPDGASARTRYRVLSVHGRYALVSLVLETGRTHQIRVHMAQFGCPIVGDFLYGTEHPAFPHCFALHSAVLKLVQPITGEPILISAPLPSGFSTFLQPEQSYLGGFL